MYDLSSPPTAREAYRAILIADAAMAQDAAEAIDITGGRLLSRIGWDAVAAGLAQTAARPVIVVEAQGVADDVLATGLARIDGFATALDLGIVVALDTSQIDIVAAAVFGPQVQLLCDPPIGDRVAALTIAAELSRGVALHDRVREGEAARLARLNAEVARIAELLARLTRMSDDAADDGVADRRQRFAVEGAAPDHDLSAADIRRTIRARRLRDQFFGAGLFEDPGWDMLLDLFAAELECARVSVSSLCIAAAVAPTTALRWIARMTDIGLFERRPDPQDRRRVFMVLSRRASDAMRNYMVASRRANLDIA